MEITAAANASIRKSLACFRDTDAVVGEVAVHLRNINLHHMTGCASTGRDRACTGSSWLAVLLGPNEFAWHFKHALS